MKLSPQNQAVLSHLQKVGQISNLEAHMVHKIRSISSRVSELNRAGFNITKVRKQDATGQWYISYKLVDAPTTTMPPPLFVGQRVRVVVDHVHGGVASKGAEGVVVSIYDFSNPSSPVAVAFDKGNFYRYGRGPDKNIWYVRRNEVVVIG